MRVSIRITEFVDFGKIPRQTYSLLPGKIHFQHNRIRKHTATNQPTNIHTYIHTYINDCSFVCSWLFFASSQKRLRSARAQCLVRRWYIAVVVGSFCCLLLAAAIFVSSFFFNFLLLFLIFVLLEEYECIYTHTQISRAVFCCALVILFLNFLVFLKGYYVYMASPGTQIGFSMIMSIENVECAREKV